MQAASAHIQLMDIEKELNKSENKELLDPVQFKNNNGFIMVSVGPLLWFLEHTCALYADDHQTDISNVSKRARFKQFNLALTVLFPCMECRNRYTCYMSLHESELDDDKGKSLWAWSEEAHTYVNKELKKPMYELQNHLPFDVIDRAYREKYSLSNKDNLAHTRKYFWTILFILSLNIPLPFNLNIPFHKLVREHFISFIESFCYLLPDEELQQKLYQTFVRDRHLKTVYELFDHSNARQLIFTFVWLLSNKLQGEMLSLAETKNFINLNYRAKA